VGGWGVGGRGRERNMRGNGEDLGGVHSSRYGHNYRHDRVIGLYICIYIYTYIYIYIDIYNVYVYTLIYM
jgi:hypothetical protein